MTTLDYVYYRVDDFYRRKPRFLGGALGGFSAVHAMAFVGMMLVVNSVFTIWHMVLKIKSPYPSSAKPVVVVVYFLLIVYLWLRYNRSRRKELRSCYFAEIRDARWRLKGYLITFVILFSTLYVPLIFIVFGKVVHLPGY